MRTLLSIGIIFIFLASGLFAQVEGVVTDNETKQPIPSANIWIENEEIGTTSDQNGYIPFPQSGVFVGFEFLIIKENEYLPHKYWVESEEEPRHIVTNKGEVVAYTPFVGLVNSKEPNDFWVYRKGKWIKDEQQLTNNEIKKQKHKSLTLELTLNN